MFGKRRTRTLLGPADPARHTPTARPRLSAQDLIARAEATQDAGVGHRRAHPTRRLVLAGALVAVAAGAGMIMRQLDVSDADNPKTASAPTADLGPVLVPIAYQVVTGTPAAGAQLRALAKNLGDAPYENHTGRYAYHVIRVWGDPVMVSPDNRYVLGYASERKIWQAADGTGQQITTQLKPEFPDQESRDYWERNLKGTATGAPAPNTVPLPPLNLAPLPSGRVQLAELLRARSGPGAVGKQITMVYTRHAVPRQTRAEILQVLAGVPGFLWRGEVTDRAGRKGVAITFDDAEADQRSLLIFNPKTGELLAHELSQLTSRRIRTYQVILDTDRTDQPK